MQEALTDLRTKGIDYTLENYDFESGPAIAATLIELRSSFEKGLVSLETYTQGYITLCVKLENIIRHKLKSEA